MNREQLDTCMSALAQGVINITEGITTIEAESRIHRAMAGLVTAHVQGAIAAQGPRDAIGHLTDAIVSINNACSAICSIKGANVAAIWRQLGKLSDAVKDARSALDAELHMIPLEDTKPSTAPDRTRRKR